MNGLDLPILRNRFAFRMVLAFFALAQALNGLWALFAPRSFYEDFPLGRGWVELLPPYNEHLTRDLGALYLATAVMLGAAAWSLRRTFVGSALIAWLAFATPHAIWHLFNLDPYSTGDAAANLVTLAATVFLPIALLVLLVRDRPPDRLAAEMGNRREVKNAVLVTGGTGVLGSRVVSRLAAGGNAVRVLSRRERHAADGVQTFRGELRSGEGLGAAVEGVDTIVHCASSPLWRARVTEVSGLRNLIAATSDARPHLLYISIVGVDRIPYYYYRAKWEAEQVLSASSLPWTILRATQFHYLISKYAIGRLAVAPKGSSVQLLDASEVADRLVELVEAGPSGRVPDMGGPEILTIPDVAQLHKKVLGRRLWALELPAVGRAAQGFRDGFNLCPDQAVGRITYEEYLRSLGT